MTTGVRDTILPFALAEVAVHGFSDAALKAAAEKAGVNQAELKAAFPNGGASLVEAFSHWADDRTDRDLPEHGQCACVELAFRPFVMARRRKLALPRSL